MSEKERTTVYILKPLRRKADALMKFLTFGDNFTGFVEQLIREEWERRGGDAALAQFMEPKPLHTFLREQVEKVKAEVPGDETSSASEIAEKILASEAVKAKSAGGGHAGKSDPRSTSAKSRGRQKSRRVRQ